MHIGRRDIGFLHLGHDVWSDRYCLRIGLWPRRRACEGEIPFHLNFRVEFCLPPIVYWRNAPPHWPGAASAWTGREVEIYEIKWRYWRPVQWSYVP